MTETYASRVRVRFATGETVKYVGHLDMHRCWERAIRRARLPLAYTQGFNPQPRLQFAAALPVGFTGENEVADLFLDHEIPGEEVASRLQGALPSGITVLDARPVARELPSLQSQVCGASYVVEVESPLDQAGFESLLGGFLARDTVWRERRRGKESARYDLRPLVHMLRYVRELEGGHAFEVEMRAEPGATGRPDELLDEIGLGEAWRRIVRTRLALTGDREAATPPEEL
jgi:radical SAM-linked protein